jgi:hypothetical protein
VSSGCHEARKAGLGYFAVVEESDSKRIRKILEANFFWVSANMMLAVLPGIRDGREGKNYIMERLRIQRSRSFEAADSLKVWLARLKFGSPLKGPIRSQSWKPGIVTSYKGKFLDSMTEQ